MLSHIEGTSAVLSMWLHPLAAVGCHQVSAETSPLLLRSAARVARLATFKAPLGAVTRQAVLPWFVCMLCPHEGLAGTPSQASGMLCSRGMGRRTAPVSVGKCNAGRAAQAGGSSPLSHNPTASTVESPWLATPQVPSVVWMVAGALVSPWGSKFPCQQLPGSCVIWLSARSPLVTLPKKPLSWRKLLATSLP